MPQTNRSEPTQALEATADPLDAALAAAFGPDSGPPLPASGSVIQALGESMPSVPRVHLREPAGERATPVNLPNSPAMPPVNLTGRLQLIGEIARGGMGAILKGRDVDLGRDIAVKVLLETHQGKTELAQRFIEEAQISGQLQHPGVAPVYELGVLADRRPYFTMKLVKGQTLAALLAARKELTEDRSKHLGAFAQVCQTLAYAHARGVIHRDLKPSNVMVGAFGEVQVMDWGLAKVLQEGGVADEKKTQRRPEVSVIRTQRSQGSSTPETGSHTQAGSILGTPAYMAPEQARGDVDLVDERADVFGLGAILCEILTGEPPFTGKGAEAQRKAQGAMLDDAFARLDNCGADAELLDLAKHCLAAEPWDRPREAGAVAAAMAEYQSSVADKLRQAELERAAAEARALEEVQTRQMAEARALAERRRRRTTLALAAALLALFVVGGGAGAWWWRERTAVTRDVEAALALAAEHGQAGRWPEAGAALERAEARLGGVAPGELHEKVKKARTDAAMVARLEEIRLRTSESNDKSMSFDLAGEAARFADAFRDYGIDVSKMDMETAAARVRDARIREPLIAALDEWTSDLPAAEKTKLRAVAQAADGNAWRRSFRDADAANDKKKIEQLATSDEALAQPPLVLLSLGYHLAETDLERGAALLRQGQRRYPGDFWTNYSLGSLLYLRFGATQLEEAAGYMRVAVGVRPGSAAAHTFLGSILFKAGDTKGGIAEYRQAIALNPSEMWAYNNLGNALRETNDLDGALEALQRARMLAPNNALIRSNLALVHQKMGDAKAAEAGLRKALALDSQHQLSHVRLGHLLKDLYERQTFKTDLEGAIAAYRRILALHPNDAELVGYLRTLLMSRGRMEEARADWKKALERNPPDHDSWYGYAELCLFLGQDAEYEHARRALLDRFGAATNPNVAERTGRACLLLPAAGDELRQATALTDRGIAAGPSHGSYPYFMVAKGLSEYRQGRHDGAADWLEKAIARGVPMPARLVLAMARYRQGQSTEARKTLSDAVSSYNWNQGSTAGFYDPWICHVLRREAELLIHPHLALFLKGEYEPIDNQERLELIDLCTIQRYYSAVAKLFVGAFAAEAALANDMSAQHRYNAACAAAQAGSGQGRDTDLIDEKERAAWRKQSLIWLEADLAAYAERLASGKIEDRILVMERLEHWHGDSDLRGLRDREAIAKLPAQENEACEKLWANVQVLLKKVTEKTK